MLTEISPLQKQEEFLGLTGTHNLLVSGYGFGKTECKLIALLMDMQMYGKYGARFALYDPTHDLLTVNTIPRLIEKLELSGIKYKFNKQEKIISTTGYGTIFLRSMDNPSRIVAYEVFRSYIDEIETMRPKQIKEVWNKINGRNRQTLPEKPNAKNRTYTFTTPDAGFGFTFETWGKAEDKQAFQYVTASTRDNPYLPEDYVKNLEAIYPDGMVKAFIEGKWTNILSGQVYTEFDRERCHDSFEIKPEYKLSIGQDFNVGGCVSIIGYMHNGVLFIVGEMVSDTTYSIADNYKERYSNKAYIYPDASGSNKSSNATVTDLEILEKEKLFSIQAEKSNPRISERVLTVNVALKTGKLKIDTKACPKLTEALEQQAYTDNGEPEKESGAATKDDYNDALGYMVHKLLTIESQLKEIKFKFSH